MHFNFCSYDLVVLQLLLALKQCHEEGICHGGFSWLGLLLMFHFSFSISTFFFFNTLPYLGDIKCENVLVTSWNWLYLADFASFKPTYIPYDDPSDFSFFFDTGGRRLCYLAPEVGFSSDFGSFVVLPYIIPFNSLRFYETKSLWMCIEQQLYT